VVKEDLLRSYVPNVKSPYDELGHGSGVASLVAYYALALGEGAENIGKVWIASARIMDATGQLEPHPVDDEEEYRRRDAKLLSTTLKRIVEDFTPKGVRIFVMAYNVVNKLWNTDSKAFTPRTSWVARTIDQLSREHNIIFVLITGNLQSHELRDCLTRSQYPLYLSGGSCSIIDPAQAVSAVTVGSVAHSAKAAASKAAPLAQPEQISPFTRIGPGINEAIKPEFVERGGNTLVDASLGVIKNLGTNVLMATHQATPPLQHDCGTSFAGPRVAHHLALILHELQSLQIDPSACLLKCFLAQSARRSPELSNLDEHFTNEQILNICGFGIPDHQRALECDGSSAIFYYDGEIQPDNVALFNIPIPDELKQSREKRISVSVCFSPQVQRWGLEEYTSVRVKFRLFKGVVSPDAVEQALALEDGEENTPVDKPENELTGEYKISLRSRGTLQHDTFTWSREDENSIHDYSLAVIVSKASWGKESQRVPLAVVIKMEDTTRTIQTVYVSAQSRVQARQRVSHP
jgi:hypothetical protein